MGRIIAIASGKGGVGKTTITSYLGTNLAQSDKKVLLIDMDFGLHNLDIILGLEKRCRYHFLDVVNGKCRMKQAIVPIYDYNSLWLLPSPDDWNPSAISLDKIYATINQMKKSFDIIILDCPAGMGMPCQIALTVADDIYLISTTDITAIHDATQMVALINSLKREKAAHCRLILNKVSYNMIKKEQLLNEISNIIGIPIITVITNLYSFRHFTWNEYNRKPRQKKIQKQLDVITEKS